MVTQHYDGSNEKSDKTSRVHIRTHINHAQQYDYCQHSNDNIPYNIFLFDFE